MKNKTFDTVIILTACINPNGMSETVLQNSDIRLQQYLKALKFYLCNTDLPIIFIENTNYDITGYFPNEVNNGRLEILTFNGNDFDKSKGKGYGEAIILQHAIQNSKLIKHAKRVIKITGRIIVKNIKQLINCSKKTNTIYANLAQTNSKEYILASIFFIVPIHFLNDYFLMNKEIIDDSKNYYFEHLLYDQCKRWVNHGNDWKEYMIPIYLEGQSGTTGDHYKNKPYIYSYIVSFIKYWIHKSKIPQL